MSTLLSLLFVPCLMIATGIVGYFVFGWVQPADPAEEPKAVADLFDKRHA